MTPDDQLVLRAAVGFSPDELALNRAGKLSERQRSELGRSRRSGRTGSLVMLSLALVFVVVIAAVALPKLGDNQHGKSHVPIVPIAIGVLVLVVLLVGLSTLRLRRRLDRLASGAVSHVEGPVRTRVHRLPGNVPDLASGPIYGGGVRYELTVGNTTFFVAGPAVLDAFDTAGTYRAHYATGGGHSVYNRLLSAERIG